MDYFSKRNRYNIEYSGHEEVSRALRIRIIEIIKKYVRVNYAAQQNESRPYFIKPDDFQYIVLQEILKHDYILVLENGTFEEVFTVVEIFLNKTECLDFKRRDIAISDISQAFYLSGSVYEIDLRENKIVLIPGKELMEQVKQAGKILELDKGAHGIFFEAVGNLFSRSVKYGDIVRDIYVAAEVYLKLITDESRYSMAIKKLKSKGHINNEQKNVMDQLNSFQSNTKGTTHAGSSPRVDERQALWFLDTMSAQLRNIGVRKIKED